MCDWERAGSGVVAVVVAGLYTRFSINHEIYVVRITNLDPLLGF